MAEPALRLLDKRFRWRGHEPTRLEGFSDAVFGFAITLLMVSLDVPRSYAALLQAMEGFFSFAFCFAILFVLWYQHHKFCRRYALEDKVTLVLTAVLLFLVLFYIYPLKFLMSLMTAGWFGRGVVESNAGHARTLMVVYGAGISAIYAVYTGLYANALRHKDALGLTRLEQALTRSATRENLLFSCVGLVSITVAVCVRPQWIGISGLCYFLFAPVGAIHGWLSGRVEGRLAKAEQALPTQSS